MTLRRTKKRHQTRRIAAAVCGTPWLLETSKITAIQECLNLRAAGESLSRDEVLLRVGDCPADYQPKPHIAGGIALLPLQGILAPRMNMMIDYSGGTSMQQFGRWFASALANADVRAIVIDVDSPGGTVPGTKELADQIFAARGTTQKPIIGVASGAMAASAAYWILSACSEVVASPGSMLGSIGAVMYVSEDSKALEEAGTKVTPIFSGGHKVDGNPYEPLSKEAKAAIQLRVDDAGRAFVEAVARNRGVGAADVERDFGQGQMFMAPRALELGLADRIATLDQVLTGLAAKFGASATSNANPNPISFGSRSAAVQIETTDPREQEVPPVKWELIKAALVARGYCNAAASQEQVQAALNVFLAARGLEFSATEGDAILAAINTVAVPTAPVAIAQPLQPAAPAAQQVAPQLAQPAAPAPQQTAQQIIAAERDRMRDIQARGTLLGIDATLVQAAIDEGIAVEAAVMRFTERQNPTLLPVTRGPGVSVNGSSLDGIYAGATEALFARFIARSPRMEGRREVPALTPAARPFARMSFAQIAAATIDAAGARSREMDDEDVATQFLKLAGTDHVPFAAFGDRAANTPGMYPNILSALAGKVMDAAVETAEATYDRWASQQDDVADFKPRPIAAMGGSPELPLLIDGEDFTQSKRSEEVSWVQADPFGVEFKVTPRMVANDDLGAFMDEAADQQIAHELTLNRLCVNLLTGNPVIPFDSVAFFHATHANLIAGGSGGVPSMAQVNSMRVLLLNQTDPGGVRKLRIQPALALVPTTLITGAEQFFLPATIVPITDATVNVFRGKIIPICEPMLDDADTAAWYLFANPGRIRTVIYAFMRGYGKGGRKRTYYNPANNCQTFQIEGRFGGGVRNWRGAVKNTGN